MDGKIIKEFTMVVKKAYPTTEKKLMKWNSPSYGEQDDYVQEKELFFKMSNIEYDNPPKVYDRLIARIERKGFPPGRYTVNSTYKFSTKLPPTNITEGDILEERRRRMLKR